MTAKEATSSTMATTTMIRVDTVVMTLHISSVRSANHGDVDVVASKLLLTPIPVNRRVAAMQWKAGVSGLSHSKIAKDSSAVQTMTTKPKAALLSIPNTSRNMTRGADGKKALFNAANATTSDKVLAANVAVE